MPEVKETKAVYRRIAWLLLVVNLAVPAFVMVQRNGNHLTDAANIWVGWISATMLTVMLVVGTYLRLPMDRRQIPRSMVLTSLALVVLSGLITTVCIAASPSDDYLAVALSDTPLNKIKPDRKRLIVELIRKNKAASDENSRIAKTMKPISPALYSLDYFANKTAMESTSSQLKQAYDIDKPTLWPNIRLGRRFTTRCRKSIRTTFEASTQKCKRRLFGGLDRSRGIKMGRKRIESVRLRNGSRQRYLTQRRRPSRDNKRGAKAEPSATDQREHSAKADDDGRQGQSCKRPT